MDCETTGLVTTLLHLYRENSLNYSSQGPHHLVSQAKNDPVEHQGQDGVEDSKDLFLCGRMEGSSA